MSVVYQVRWNPDTRTARRVNGITGTRPGVVVVQARVSPSQSSAQTARDILRALGRHRYAYAVRPSDSAEQIRQAQCWVEVEGISDIIITGANWLPGRALTDLISFAGTVSARLWLVNYQPPAPTPARRGVLADAIDITADEFKTAWLSPPMPGAAPPAPAVSAYPRVPDTCSTSFLADCADLLDPAGHRQVEQLFYTVLDDLNARFAKGEHGIRVIANTFQDWFERLATPDEVLTAARAIEAAALPDGYLVAVNPDRVRVTADREPRRATRSPGQWDEMRIYASTEVGAYCALLAARFTAEQAVARRLRDLTVNGFQDVIVKTPGSEPTVITEGSAYLAAHYRYRQLDGARPRDLLFTTRTGAAVRPETAALYARLPSLEVGLDTITTIPINRRSVRTWAAWCGVTITRIGHHRHAN